MIRISEKILWQIQEYCIEQLPTEACGYLGGIDGVVSEVRLMRNSSNSPIEFSFDPSEQFQAVREFRSKGVSVIGVFHSHPNGKAKLSSKDIHFAEDGLLQMVVAINNKKCLVNCFECSSTNVIPRELTINK